MPRFSCSPAVLCLLLAALAFSRLAPGAELKPGLVYQQAGDAGATWQVISGTEIEFRSGSGGPAKTYRYMVDGRILRLSGPDGQPAREIATTKSNLRADGYWFFPVKDAEAARLYQASGKKYRAGDRAGAIELLTQAIQQDGTFALAYGDRARYRIELKQVAAAREDIAKALELDDQISYLYGLIGRLAVEDGDWVKAERAFRQAVALDPEAAENHNNLGAVIEKQGRMDEAMAELRLAVKANSPFPVYRVNLGSLLVRMQKYPEAVEIYDALLKEEPRNATYLCNYGVALYFMGKNDEAIAAFQQALAINPSLKDAKENLATALKKKDTAPTPAN